MPWVADRGPQHHVSPLPASAGAHPLRRPFSDRLGGQAGQKRACAFAQKRMPPFRRDIGERHQDESPLMRARMRQNQVRPGAAEAIDVDDVEIERPRRVGDASHPAEPRLDRLQGGQQHLRRDRSSQARDAIDKGRLARRRHRRRLIPGRGRDQRKARDRGNLGQGARHGLVGWRPIGAGEIGTERDQNHITHRRAPGSFRVSGVRVR